MHGYSTDIITNYTLGYIDDAVSGGKPFFIVAAPIAPHVSLHVTDDDDEKIPFPNPKVEYAHLYPHLRVPRNPNFNPANRSGVLHIWNLDHLSDNNVDFLDEYYRHRQRTLKSVDDMVEQIMKKLEGKGVLENTYVIFSSDNGYHVGQHRLQGGKKQCFEEDINVPFIIRGPNIAAGETTDMVTGHVDVTPTILNMAGVNIKDDWELDGQGLSFPLKGADDLSMAKQARGEHVNLEYWGTFQQEGKYHCECTDSEFSAQLIMEQTDKRTRMWKSRSRHIKLSAFRAKDIALCMRYGATIMHMSCTIRRYFTSSYQPGLELSLANRQHWDPYQMSNLHPNAPAEDGQQNPFQAGHNTILGRPIPQLVHRLDAIILVQKTCKQDECRNPWSQLHTDGSVANLLDALDEKYDSMYTRLHEIGKVEWEHCYEGDKYTLYLKSNERPLWEDVKDEVLGDETRKFRRWDSELWF